MRTTTWDNIITQSNTCLKKVRIVKIKIKYNNVALVQTFFVNYGNQKCFKAVECHFLESTCTKQNGIKNMAAF